VHEPTLSLLAGWESFYVIIGSSAAALTGLQFVVIVLGAETGVLRSEVASRAYATPTVVHFCAVLLLAAVLSAPWHTFMYAERTLAAGAILGFLYAATLIVHARRQTDYKPVLEDWLWHSIFPLIVYAGLAISALMLEQAPDSALFAIGGLAIALLFIGIHNAWDSALYLALQRNTNLEANQAALRQTAAIADATMTDVVTPRDVSATTSSVSESR